MFLDIDKKPKDKVAVIDDSGSAITYGEITSFATLFGEQFSHRTLIFILAENKIGSLLGYTAALSNRIVPLILSSKTEAGLFDNLFKMYQPGYLWLPDELVDRFAYNVIFSSWSYSLVKTEYASAPMYEDLSMLLPTSGSTGSPKLVRHSYRNIEANAYNVQRLFQLQPEDRAMAILPMHYTMGLSVISSHLRAGATLLLSDKSLLDKNFWKMLKEQRATSFTGVPYSFDILMKMRFTRMDLPDLKVITQGGGKLTPEMFHALAQYAHDNNKQFIATYGQSECTARMAYLPPHLALEKTCSIGIAEPGGQLSIMDSDGKETFVGEATGEMIYRGENVTLGYATCREDLLKGDENHGVMHTGDIAHRDADGCYFIVGRMKRFLKIFGLRIGLDEVENMIRQEFDVDCFCKGNDEKLIVLVPNKEIAKQLPAFIEGKTKLFHQRIEVQVVDRILRNEAGKVVSQ